MKIMKNFAIWSLFLIKIVFAGPQWFAAKDGTRFLIEKDSEYNWFQASDECAQRDAHLVTVNSEEKKNQIKQVLKAALIADHNLWIGGNDVHGKRHDNLQPFYGSATGREFSCKLWAECQPDNSHEQCVHIIQYFYPPKEWNDNSCHNTKIGYICEEKIAKKTSEDDIDVEESKQIFKELQPFKLESTHGHKLRAEDQTNENESVKKSKIASVNMLKWKDIIKSSIIKKKLNNIKSLFKFNGTAFKEPQDQKE